MHDMLGKVRRRLLVDLKKRCYYIDRALSRAINIWQVRILLLVLLYQTTSTAVPKRLPLLMSRHTCPKQRVCLDKTVFSKHAPALNTAVVPSVPAPPPRRPT